jgi:hypothetical protein
VRDVGPEPARAAEREVLVEEERERERGEREGGGQQPGRAARHLACGGGRGVCDRRTVGGGDRSSASSRVALGAARREVTPATSTPVNHFPSPSPPGCLGCPTTMSIRPSSSQGGREGEDAKRHKNDRSKEIHHIILSRLNETSTTVNENTDLEGKAGARLAAGFIKACQSLELPGAVFNNIDVHSDRLWDDSTLMGLILTAYLKCDFSQVLSNGTRASPRKFLCGLT